MHSTPKKEKHRSNSRIPRRSEPEKKSRKEKDNKDKDTDFESVISASSTPYPTGPPASHSSKCPLRFLLSGMIDAKGGKQNGCPLRRVQLWHTIPLCLLAIINLLLIIVMPLGLAVYKITKRVHSVVIEMMRSDMDIELYVDKGGAADTGSEILEEN
ncbi:hypothetical protein EYC84_009941 [Monilinia fructicola]|uniref:Uncharacterized protein n=1 Tax=Monilinia fructicola TaxID=38448 RepID=A0A5M9JG90_MONFR|nr:hypothetical protein EYC84_009941 [Monilinia fructicola]